MVEIDQNTASIDAERQPIINLRPVFNILMTLSICGALAIVGKQVIDWLRFGRWTPCSIQDVLEIPLPVFSWVGIERIFEWGLAFPASLALIICAVAFIVAHENVKAPSERPVR